MTKSSSDSPPKGLNWAETIEGPEKVDDEAKTRLYRLDRGAQTNDLKGLFSKELPEVDRAAGKFPTPVIRPSLSVPKPKSERKKGVKASVDATYKEPPAATFGGGIKPATPPIELSEGEAKQAALGLFGRADRAAMVQSDSGQKATGEAPSPATLKLAAKSSLASAPLLKNADEAVTSVGGATPKPNRELLPVLSPSTTGAEGGPIGIKVDTVESEPPTEPFVLPSPLPEKPLPPPSPPTRDVSPAPKRSIPIPIPSPEPAVPLGVQRSELDSIPPVKRTRSRAWTAALIGLLVLTASGATAFYAGFIKVPFKTGSLLSASPKVAIEQAPPPVAPSQVQPPVASSAPSAPTAATAPVEIPAQPSTAAEAPPFAVQPTSAQEALLQQAAVVEKTAPEGIVPKKAQEAKPASVVAAALPIDVPIQADARRERESEAAPGPIAAPREPAAKLVDAKDVSNAIGRAEQLLKKGDIIEADALLRDVLAKEPDEHHAMEVLIRVLLKRGKAAEALPFAKRIVEKRSRRAPYRVLYGDVLAATGDRSGAEQQWQEALVIEPDSPTAKRRLGQ